MARGKCLPLPPHNSATGNRRPVQGRISHVSSGPQGGAPLALGSARKRLRRATVRYGLARAQMAGLADELQDLVNSVYMAHGLHMYRCFSGDCHFRPVVPANQGAGARTRFEAPCPWPSSAQWNSIRHSCRRRFAVSGASERKDKSLEGLVLLLLETASCGDSQNTSAHGAMGYGWHGAGVDAEKMPRYLNYPYLASTAGRRVRSAE